MQRPYYIINQSIFVNSIVQHNMIVGERCLHAIAVGELLLKPSKESGILETSRYHKIDEPQQCDLEAYLWKESTSQPPKVRVDEVGRQRAAGDETTGRS